ncbi:hypothetical protein K2Q00_02150 [Patescibacteria group bacterium]|nr:hypothetical protein [Patescibacteria group bacterium]
MYGFANTPTQPNTQTASVGSYNESVVTNPTSDTRTDTQTDAEDSPRCNPNYSGCLKSDASDYDCAEGSGDGPYYTGPVRVIGYDQYGLDRDHDGWACEKN